MGWSNFRQIIFQTKPSYLKTRRGEKRVLREWDCGHQLLKWSLCWVSRLTFMEMASSLDIRRELRIQPPLKECSWGGLRHLIRCLLVTLLGMSSEHVQLGEGHRANLEYDVEIIQYLPFGLRTPLGPQDEMYVSARERDIWATLLGPLAQEWRKEWKQMKMHRSNHSSNNGILFLITTTECSEWATPPIHAAGGIYFFSVGNATLRLMGTTVFKGSHHDSWVYMLK